MSITSYAHTSWITVKYYFEIVCFHIYIYVYIIYHIPTLYGIFLPTFTIKKTSNPPKKCSYKDISQSSHGFLRNRGLECWNVSNPSRWVRDKDPRRMELVGGGFFSGKKTTGNTAVDCVLLGFILGVYNCCFMLFPLFCWENLKWSKDVSSWGFYVLDLGDLLFFLEIILLLRMMKLIANVAMWNRKNWGTHLGKIQQIMSCWYEKKIPSKVGTSCWMFVSAFQAMKLIETAQGGGGWVLLSNYLELMQCMGIHGKKTCGGLIMCTNLEWTKKTKHTTKSLFFHIREKNQWQI